MKPFTVPAGDCKVARRPVQRAVVFPRLDATGVLERGALDRLRSPNRSRDAASRITHGTRGLALDRAHPVGELGRFRDKPD